jgi:hypothetical protein
MANIEEETVITGAPEAHNVGAVAEVLGNDSVPHKDLHNLTLLKFATQSLVLLQG